MSRQLLCLKCGDEKKPHPEDAKMGCTFRRCYISLKKTPAPDHGRTLITADQSTFTPMPDYHCDLCSEVISGEIVVAVTIAPPGRSIGEWEHEVGKVMTDAEVETYRKMEK